MSSEADQRDRMAREIVERIHAMSPEKSRECSEAFGLLSGALAFLSRVLARQVPPPARRCPHHTITVVCGDCGHAWMTR